MESPHICYRSHTQFAERCCFQPCVLFSSLSIWQRIGKRMVVFTIRIRRMGKVMFSVCSLPEGGTPVRLPVPSPDSGPRSFPGSYPVSSAMSLRGAGYPSLLIRTGVPLLASQDWGTFPTQDSGTPPPNRLHCGRYASCGFPQEDLLVLCVGWGAIL